MNSIYFPFAALLSISVVGFRFCQQTATIKSKVQNFLDEVELVELFFLLFPARHARPVIILSFYSVIVYTIKQ